MQLNLIKKPLGEHTEWRNSATPSRWIKQKNAQKYLVMHQTGCLDCDAERMWNSYNNYPVTRAAGAHYFIDDKICYEMVDPHYVTWNCGGGNGDIVNGNTIAIEMCIFKDKQRYLKVLEHTESLVAYLVEKYGVSPQNIVTHEDASGKFCPDYLLRGVHGMAWDTYLDRLQRTCSTGIKIEPLSIRLNGKVKECDAVNVDGYNYVKLRDLADDKITIDFKDGVPIVEVGGNGEN